VARTGFSLWDDSANERRAFGGIEMALWDLRAKRAGVPLVDLLGGRVRDSVAFTEYFALRVGRDETPADVVRYCEQMAAEFDAPVFEGKLGVLDGLEPVEDAAIVRLQERERAETCESEQPVREHEQAAGIDLDFSEATGSDLHVELRSWGDAAIR
jgi:L-alanine-DL-glutamate epimerase-like enolase superfamily enzyme